MLFYTIETNNPYTYTHTKKHKYTYPQTYIHMCVI